MKKNKFHAFAAFIILAFAWWFHQPYINEPPSHIHAWAQADRYAISLRFLENGFDISKPETYLMNHQFPDDFNTPTHTSITSVDFPITEYIVALLMKLFGTDSPWIFRLFMLMYASIGAYFFYLFVLKFSEKYWLAITALFFLLTSPLWLYYQASFLPSVIALSNVFIGLYFYKKHEETMQMKWYYWAYFFFALAALVRLPFIMLPFSLALSETYFAIKNKKAKYKKLIAVLVSFLIILGYYFYNKFLTQTYGSMFLNHIMPARSFDEIKYIFLAIYTNWKTDYFTVWHYYLILIFLGIFLWKYLISKKEIFRQNERSWIHLIIYFGGCILYFFLMARQFVDHDYYFLDTFFIPILLLFILLANQSKGKLIVMIVSIAILVNAFGFASDTLKKRRQNSWDDNIFVTFKNFENSEGLLDKLNVSKDAKIMVLGAYSTNIPFIAMNRKGYVMMKLKPENYDKILNWDYDYLVIQRIFFFKDIQSNYPKLYQNFEPIGGDRNLIICKKKTNSNSIANFIKNENEKVIWKDSIDFESPIVSKFWGNTMVDSTVVFKDKYVGITNTNNEYGIGYFIQKNQLPVSENITLKLTGYFYKTQKENKNLQLVVQVSDKYYKSFNIDEMIKNKESWTYSGLMIPVPDLQYDYKDEIKLYILNPSGAELYYDNLFFEIFVN